MIDEEWEMKWKRMERNGTEQIGTGWNKNGTEWNKNGTEENVNKQNKTEYNITE